MRQAIHGPRPTEVLLPTVQQAAWDRAQRAKANQQQESEAPSGAGP